MTNASANRAHETTSDNTPKFEFDILIDESLAEFIVDKKLNPINNKAVLSLINDFENGSWRYEKFQNFIWDNIAETALSASERKNLANKSRSTLAEAAKKLRLTDNEKEDIGRGSELAEIVLYGIMKHHYKALPVVPKIFYKQNAQDYAKGSDSVHIVIENDNDFSLWFGEAKFYNDIENARLDSIVTSVQNCLQTDKLKKENSIITSLSDLDELVTEPLRTKIKQALKHEVSIDYLKPRLHIPILLLHECTITQPAQDITEEYKSKIIAYHKQRAEAYFEKQIQKIGAMHKYSEIHFHIILFPVPVKQTIVDNFMREIVLFKLLKGK